ncbi:MAG TPA: hypothetical protein VGB77_08595 [Abditibacteriaceae bacterium]|jgi:hypothetical protein
MQKIQSVVVILCAMAWYLLAVAPCVQAQAPSYDPIFVKIAPETLKKELRRNSKDAEELVKLIRRSIESKQLETAFQALDQLRREQPNNAAVLAAYVMVYDASLYQVRKVSGTIRERKPQEKQIRDAASQKAKKLDPKLWLPYTIEGFPIVYQAIPSDKEYQQGLDLLKKATLLAPSSFFARKQFAAGLTVAAINKRKWNGKVVTYQQATAQYEIALKLEPKSADVTFALFSIYDIDLKDKDKATKAKRAFLQSLPPNYNIRKSIRQRLAKYPD